MTGAGSGVGRACSFALVTAGWMVVLVGRHEPALWETAYRADRSAGRAVPMVADITDPAAVEGLFASVREQYGRLDLLFNNAAETMGWVPADVPDDNENQVLTSIATGSSLCAQAAFRLMKTQSPPGGRIINNGAPLLRADSTAVTAARHVIAGLTRSLSIDGPRYGIACGQIDIDIVAPVGQPESPQAPADRTVRLAPTVDLGRVAEAVVAMAGLPPNVNIPSVTVLPTAHLPTPQHDGGAAVATDATRDRSATDRAEPTAATRTAPASIAGSISVDPRTFGHEMPPQTRRTASDRPARSIIGAETP